MSEEIISAGDEGPAAYLKHAAAGRHRAVQDVTRWFDYRHLPAGLPRRVSRELCVSACNLLDAIEADDPELTRGLSRLIEAKDALVRAAIVSQPAEDLADDEYRLTDAGKARADAETAGLDGDGA